MFNLIAITEILVSAYLLFSALTGKNRMFTSPYVKEGMEGQYKKTGRTGFCITGIMLLLLGLLNFYMNVAEFYGRLSIEMLNILSIVAMALMLLVIAAFITLFIRFSKMHDKEKKQYPARPTAPRAAFYFEEGSAPAASPRKRKK